MHHCTSELVKRGSQFCHYPWLQSKYGELETPGASVRCDIFLNRPVKSFISDSNVSPPFGGTLWGELVEQCELCISLVGQELIIGSLVAKQ